MESVDDCGCHLAALIAIPDRRHAPGASDDTNIRKTWNFLHAARELRTKRLMSQDSRAGGYPITGKSWLDDPLSELQNMMKKQRL